MPVWVILRLLVNGYNKQKALPQREFLLFIFYVYITCVLMVTIMPLPMTRHATPNLDRINIVPIVNTLKEFLATFSRGRRFMKVLALENVLGNIVLFFPIGVLLPLLSARFHSFKKVVLVAFLFSFSIEFTQWIWQHFGNYRSVDIDDIILNTLGGVLGYVFAGRLFAKRARQQ